MKKTIAIIVAALVLAGVVIFILVKPKNTKKDEKKKETPTIDETLLVGSWESVDGFDYDRLTIQDNGRYRKSVSVGGTNLNISDRYEISDGCLILYYNEMGIVYRYTVTFEDENTMKFYNAGNGELVITYTRKAD